jgi:Xaa-Pro aminopeptidase
LDIWAKEPAAADDAGSISPVNAVYADISWVGVFDDTVSAHVQQCFSDLCSARDAVYAILRQKLPGGGVITGCSLDAAVRDILIDRGYKDALKHRTGHGIDFEDHGSGVNLDSIEFPDTRPVMNGSCFSVEPGLYFSDFGMRTEINLYVRDNTPVVSGQMFYCAERDFSVPQNSLLTCTA